ncbi:MAG: hypothetical protein GPJ52_01985 [Candidatus Heimdallarchaeota archaeon]|nr:hypothetical protein [Candidatus Heimdallarchaeota archaeon]
MKVEEREYYPLVAKRGIEIARYLHNAVNIKYAFEVKQWIDCNREFDVLIAFNTPKRKDPRLISIEVKQNSDAQTLFHQGMVRAQIADYVYLAFPFDSLSYYWHKSTEYKIHFEKVKKKFTYGLMVVDLPTKRVSMLNYAKQNKSLLHLGWKMKVFNKVIDKWESTWEKIRIEEGNNWRKKKINTYAMQKRMEEEKK